MYWLSLVWNVLSILIPISAKDRISTDHLKFRLRTLLDFYADMEFEKQISKQEDSDMFKKQLEEQFRGGDFV